MILLNFAHPLSAEQPARIEELTDQMVERVVDALAQFHNGQPFAEQAV